jgi:hypothetical protein
MIPPFPSVDCRFDSVRLPWEERHGPRRAAPERLRFDLPGPAAAPSFHAIGSSGARRRPSRLRLWLGEWLMALGQRLVGADMPS